MTQLATPSDSIPPMHVPSRAEKAAILAAVVLPLAATAYAVYALWNRYVGATDLVLMFVMYAVTAIGIGTGYHRMLTHRGFEAPAPVRFFFLVLGAMALQGTPLDWASTHVRHHAKADREGDPHSPLEGFWHAHLGWLFKWSQSSNVDTFGRQFQKDPVVTFISRTYLVWATLGFVIPFAIAGWSGLLWGGLVRVFVTHHITWSVNSICHTFGTRPYETTDASRNNWLIGMLALGEGWHNNHHAFPRSAVHGMRWWQFDVNAIIIRTMERLRLIRNVWTPSADERDARRRRRAPVGDPAAASGSDSASQ